MYICVYVYTYVYMCVCVYQLLIGMHTHPWLCLYEHAYIPIWYTIVKHTTELITFICIYIYYYIYL